MPINDSDETSKTPSEAKALTTGLWMWCAVGAVVLTAVYIFFFRH